MGYNKNTELLKEELRKMKTDRVEIETQYRIKVYEGESQRFKEWIVPIVIIENFVKWLIEKRRDGITTISEETELCKYTMTDKFVDIRRKDKYTNLGWSLPVSVLNYLIENKDKELEEVNL